MHPTQHPNNNDVLGPPAGMSNDDCRPLAITRIRFEDGGDGVCSYWRPSAEELELLARGALVRFGCMGLTHPPVFLGVDG